MKDQRKTKAQLIHELTVLRQLVEKLPEQGDSGIQLNTEQALQKAYDALETANEQLQQHVTEIKTLYRVAVKATKSVRLEEVLEHAIEAINETIQPDNIAILLIEPETSELVIRAFSGFHGSPKLMRRPLGMGIPGKVAQTGKTILLPDVRLDKSYHPCDDIALSEVCVPLLVGEKIIGSLNLESRQLDAFDKDDVRILTILAGNLGIAIDNAQLYEDTARLKEFYENIVQGVTEAIFVEDVNGDYIFVNPATEKLLGYSRDELLGHNWTKIIADHAVSQVHQEMEKYEERQYESVVRDKNGELVPVIISARSFFDGEVFTGALAALTNITERVRAEEQLQRYAVELERANEEVKQFAYIVSHDLRAPLVNLKGFAFELRSALKVIDPVVNAALPHLGREQQQDVTLAFQEDVPEALDFIDSSATRMDRFINALLKLSRLGRREIHLEPVDMKALVQEALETLAHQIEEHQGKVTVGPLPEIVADRTSMEQIVGNLLGNAVKYLAPDRPAELEITAERGDADTTFHIRDNGRGIAEDDMDKVFAPFRRVGRQDVPGEGMGLPYVQTLVRRHGGRIWCESELGVGTTFSFTIPNHLEKGENNA